MKGERETGHYERAILGGEEVAAFVPAPLPPADPPLAIEGALRERLEKAEAALARLAIAGDALASLDWLVPLFERKEAVVSCQIEGTQASLIDLLGYEAAPTEPSADIEEVLGYLEALAFAREELANPMGLPLSMRLLNEVHLRLMRGPRAEEKEPGEIRRSQNWIGGSRPGNAVFVPPPPHRLAETITAFEKYLHAEDPLPPLIRIGLLHAQFETIHPYLDGNGRVGRILTSLLLEQFGLVRRPLLFHSLYFRWHRYEYLERLGHVRTRGDWEGWLLYFLEGVESIAEKALELAVELSTQVAQDRIRLLENRDITIEALRVFEQLARHPIVTLAGVGARLGLDEERTARAFAALEAMGILQTRPEGRWVYESFFEKISPGTYLPSLPDLSFLPF